MIHLGLVLARLIILTPPSAWSKWLSPSSALTLFLISELVIHVSSMAEKAWFLQIPDSISLKVISGKKHIEWRVVRGFKYLINVCYNKNDNDFRCNCL
jgi:hypothetical protein